MDLINLQAKAQAKTGRIEYYWFENEFVGLPLTLFHRVVIPFEPFDSGLDYVAQPEKTELVYEWLSLELSEQTELSGLDLRTSNYANAEASLYLGAAHNPVTFDRFSLQQTGATTFGIDVEMNVLFEFEGVAKNEMLKVSTIAEFIGEV